MQVTAYIINYTYLYIYGNKNIYVHNNICCGLHEFNDLKIEFEFLKNNTTLLAHP